MILDPTAVPGHGRSLSPFVILRDADGFIRFAEAVFDAREIVEVRTPAPTGGLIHAEIRLGDSAILMSDPMPGWDARPGLFQIWVADAEAVLARAVERGGVVVTPPTPFYGSVTLARIMDPWGNLWWLYQPVPGQADPLPAWEGGSDVVFRTLDEHMRAISSSAESA